MTDRHLQTSQSEGIRTSMNVVAEGEIEAPESALDGVLAEFTEDELLIQRTSTTRSGGGRTFEIRASEGETLLQFHEACIEHGIVFDVKRLARR